MLNEALPYIYQSQKFCDGQFNIFRDYGVKSRTSKTKKKEMKKKAQHITRSIGMMSGLNKPKLEIQA